MPADAEVTAQDWAAFNQLANGSRIDFGPGPQIGGGCQIVAFDQCARRAAHYDEIVILAQLVGFL